MASMSIANDPCRRDNDSDRFSLDSDLETTYSDSEEEYITSEQAQKYNPAGLRVEARRTLDYDSESDDDGDANRGYSAQTAGGFARSVMANGLRDDEDSIGSDSDYDPIISGRRDLPRAFVSGDRELDAYIPVGHAQDKVITTSTINPDTGEKEIHQYREGERERPDKVIKVVKGATKSAEESKSIVAQALAKARAEKAKSVPIADRRPVALGGKGVKAELTAEETEAVKAKAIGKQKGIEALQKLGRAGVRTQMPEKIAKEVSGERMAEIAQKKVAIDFKKADTEEKIAKAEEKVNKLLDKRMMGEAFKRIKAESQARAVLKALASMTDKIVAKEKITEFWKKAVARSKEKASDELGAEIEKQQRQALANLLSKGGVSAEVEDMSGGGASIAGTEGSDPKTAGLARAREELERLSADAKPIMVGDKELKVEITSGGKRQLKFGGKIITSNQANMETLQVIQKALEEARRTDPVAKAIGAIVVSRISQAKSIRGKGALGGQGKKKT